MLKFFRPSVRYFSLHMVLVLTGNGPISVRVYTSVSVNLVIMSQPSQSQ